MIFRQDDPQQRELRGNVDQRTLNRNIFLFILDLTQHFCFRSFSLSAANAEGYSGGVDKGLASSGRELPEMKAPVATPSRRHVNSLFPLRFNTNSLA